MFCQECFTCIYPASYPKCFIAESIFNNFDSLSEETKHSCALWNFSIRIKYDQLLTVTQTQITAFEKYLLHPNLSWNVSYIIRKLIERNDERISENIWFQLIEIINDNKHDIGTCNNALQAFNYFFSPSYSSTISRKCKQRVYDSIENIILKENNSLSMQTNAAKILKLMVTNDNYTMSDEISRKLKDNQLLFLSTDDQNTNHLSHRQTRTHSNVQIHKVTKIQTSSTKQTYLEAQSEFTDINILNSSYLNENESIRCRTNWHHCEPVSSHDNRLSSWWSTATKVSYLLRLTEKNQDLHREEFDYLIDKLSVDAFHFTRENRYEIYRKIGLTLERALQNGQSLPNNTIKLTIEHLGRNPDFDKVYSKILLEMTKQNYIIEETFLKQIQDDILPAVLSTTVRKNLLYVLAIQNERRNHNINSLVDLESLEQYLLDRTTSLSASRIFSCAASQEKKISAKAFIYLCYVVSNLKEDSHSVEVRRFSMKAICYSINRLDKIESLLPALQYCLIKAFEDSDEKICSLALQTLCFCCTVKCIRRIHPSILNESVHRIWNNRFESQSVDYLQNLTLLYLQAAKEKYLLTRNVIIDISRLLKVLDFTIRKNVILTLKHISEQSMSIVLPSLALMNVEIALNDDEFDIRSLAADVFINNWRKNPSYFLRISQTSIIKLFTNRFDIQVQKFALEILEQLVKQKQQISRELIETIAHGLLQSDLPIINFFIHYVKYHQITQNILQSIERAFDTHQYNEEFIDIFQKCVSYQLILTERTLIILGDLLLESTDETIINKLISTLELADRNQIVPEMINDLLRNQFSIQVLIHSECEQHIKYFEQQLIDATSNAQRLSNGIMNSLQNLLLRQKYTSSILQMIFNVTLIGQNLRNDLINILSDLISQTTQTNQIILIKIFLNIISNNQLLPSTFLAQLPNFILDTSVNTDIVFIYTILLERNADISIANIIDPIYRLFDQLNELNSEFKRYLSAFIKLATKRANLLPQSEILVKMLKNEDLFIRKNILETIDYLVTIKRQILDINILNSLCEINSDKKVQQIFELVEQIQLLPTTINQRLTLARCKNLHININLLEQLKLAVSQGQLLSNEHFVELSNLLYSSNTEHRILASEILKISSSMHQIIPDHVIEAISATIKDESIQSNTLPLLKKAGRIFAENILTKTIDKKQIPSDDIEQSVQLNPPSSMNLIRQLALQRVSFQNQTIEILVNKAENDFKCASSILEIIAEYQSLPSKIIRPYLNRNLLSDDQSKIRSTFIILRYQILKNSIEQPIDLLKMITLPSFIDQNRLVEEILSLDEYLNIIYTLLSVEYFDKEIFENCSVEQWSRECLCFDLLIKMNVDKESMELCTFYDSLAKLEESKGYELFDEVRDNILRFFIDKHSEFNLQRINKILVFLYDISIDVLNSNDSNWYENLVRCYIREKLLQHFPLSKYSSVIINHLTDVLFDFYQTYQSISILDLCCEPDVLIESLRRISDEKITIEELNEMLFLAKKTQRLLTKQLDLKKIKNKLYVIWKSPSNDLNRANELLQQISIRWSFLNLCLILDCAKEKSVLLTNFIQCLIIINNYQVKDDIVDEIIQSNLCPSKIFILIINHCFPKNNQIEKSKEELINKILENNQNLLQSKVLSSRLDFNFDLVKAWKEKDIQKWSDGVRKNSEWAKNEENLPEMIAVIVHAVYLSHNYQVRHVQLLAVLLLLDTAEDKRGRLAEIATGEGKLTIISMLAIIKALQGFHVDIVTSSSALARDGVKKQATLYHMFHLTVSHNSDDNRIYISGPKKCYQCSIVYGDISQFQFDILRDEFSLLNTRHKRPFDVVIIDEVDSMLIDENNKIARLAENIPGMEYLNPLLNAIYLVTNNCQDQDQEIFYKRTIIHEIKRLILEKNSQLTIPQHLRTYVLSQLPNLIDSNLIARNNYKLDHQYVIKSDENNIKRIVPIDYLNTGIIQSNTTIDDGVQQCLQIKHGLKITQLNLTTNFISNLRFFDRYTTNLYGLTGTLGSSEAKQLLCDVYSVDTIVIPRYKSLSHIELPTIILNSEDEWLETIVQSSLTETKRNRSVLIICKTRMNAKTIVKRLCRHVFKGVVKLYTDNTDSNESNIVHTQINSGDIIVATNLAGRGTDLKTSKQVEDNGGLHVCLTFVPINLRVRQQALGRTSRQGNRGTSQLILHKDDLCDDQQQTEKMLLDQIRTKDIPEIKANDKLFRKFCQLLADLREKDSDPYKLFSVKEHWGLWLKENDHQKQVKLSLIEKAKRIGLRFFNESFHSFYHVINQQLPKNLADEEIKTQMIEYILQNRNSYKDFFLNLDNDTYILYVEETMIQSLIQIFNINIVLVNSYEDFAILYQSESAIETVYIAGDFDHGYYSLELVDQKKLEKHTFMRECKDNTLMKTTTKQDQFTEKLYRIFSKQNHVEDYIQFEQTIRERYEYDDKIIQNPFYLMAKANMLIGKTQQFLFRAKHTTEKIISFGTEKCIDIIKARRCLDAAIRLDPIYSFPARVNRAYLSIVERSEDYEYKQLAKFDLHKVQDLITNFILPGLFTMKINPCETNENQHRDYDDLDKQLAIKIDIIQSYYAHIESAILEIDHSQRLVDLVVSTPRDIVTEEKLLRQQASNFIEDLNLLDETKFKLTFRSLCIQKNTTINSDQCKKLIKLVKDDYQHISIQFERISTDSAKEIVQSFKQIVQYANLRVDYLNKEEISTLFHFETLNQVTKNLTVKCKNRRQYEEILQLRGASGSINVTKKYSKKFSTSSKALNYFNYNENETILSLSLTSTRVKYFESLMERSLDDAVFSVTFNQLTYSEATNLLAIIGKQVFLEFDNLKVKQASEIFKIRKERDFFIGLDDLDKQNTRRILTKFDPNEQDLSVKLDKISDKYLDEDKPRDELAELDQSGINQFIIINELNPIPWLSVMTMTALGTAQIACGIYLAAFTGGLGAKPGSVLIIEGLNDLYFALRGAMSREINWQEYAAQKSISLIQSLLTVSFVVVSKSTQAAQAMGTTTWTQIQSIVRTDLLAAGQDITKGAMKQSLSNACKQVASSCAKRGAKEILSYSTDSLLNNYVLSRIHSEMEKHVDLSMSKIMRNDFDYQKLVQTIFFNDSYNQNHQYQYQIEQMAVNILNASNKPIEGVLSSIKGVLPEILGQLTQTDTHNHTTTTNLSAVLNKLNKCRVFTDFVSQLDQMEPLVQYFFEELKKKIAAKKIPDPIELLRTVANINRDPAEKIFHTLRTHQIFDGNGLINRNSCLEGQNEDSSEETLDYTSNINQQFSLRKLHTALDKINLTISGDNHKTSVKDFFNRILNNTYQNNIFEKTIQKIIVNHYMGVLLGMIVEPLKKDIIEKLIQSIGNTIERKLDANNQTIAECIQCEAEQRTLSSIFNEHLENVQPKKISIDLNATKQLESIALKPNAKENAREKFIRSLADNESGGYIELSLISKMTGMKFSIVENEELCNQTKSDGTIKLVYNKSQTSCEGSWKLAGSPDEQSSSLYDVVHSQLSGRFSSSKEIRTQLAEFMYKNPAYIDRIQPSINIINANSNPIHRKQLLMGSEFSSFAQQLNIEIKLHGLMQFTHNTTRTIYKTTKGLTSWIRSKEIYIKFSIEEARILFPKLISAEFAAKAKKTVTLIKTVDILFDNCEDGNVIEIIRTLCETGKIIMR